MRTSVAFLSLFLLATPLPAEEFFSEGTYRVINSAGFSETGASRRPLTIDPSTASADIAHQVDGNIRLSINGAEIQLFRLQNGLAAVEWDAAQTSLLHGVDILALLDAENPADIPAWGADVAWPTLGTVQLVLFPLSSNAVTGFLISRVQEQTVVRQMEFRQIYGPSNRPLSRARPSIALNK